MELVVNGVAQLQRAQMTVVDNTYDVSLIPTQAQEVLC